MLDNKKKKNKKFPDSVYRWLVISVLIVFTISIIKFIELFEFPSDSMFWSEVQNTGHIPLFGFFAFIVLIITSKFIKNKYPFLPYLYALSGAFLVGVISEMIHYFSPRDADIFDLAHDLLGALLCCLFYLPFDKTLMKSMKWWRKSLSFSL